MSAQATDSGVGAGAGNIATQSISVQNVAPTVALSGPSPVNESQTPRLYTFDTTDPGTDTFVFGASCGASGVVVGATFNSATGDGSFECRFADDNPTGTASDTSTVSVTIDDDDTGSDTDTLAVTVNNVDPTVVISGLATQNESQTLRTYSFDTTDPGTPDTFTAGTPDCGASGTFVGPITFNSATGDGSFDCRFADDDPTGTASDLSTLSITVTDDDTGSDSDTFVVTVNNVDPTVASAARPRSTRGRRCAPTASTRPTRAPTRSRTERPPAAPPARSSARSPSARRPATAASTAASPTTTRPAPPRTPRRSRSRSATTTPAPTATPTT